MLVNDKDFRNALHGAKMEAIGGEMEGGELLKLMKKVKSLHGVIVIKGVADYGDGEKNKDWQYTAALAAVTFTEKRLRDVSSKIILYYTHVETL